MRTLTLVLIAGLAGIGVGCGKDYKPDPNAKGGAEHEPPVFTEAPPAAGSPESAFQGQWRVERVDFGGDIETPRGDEAVLTISGNTILKADGGRASTFHLRPGSRDFDIDDGGEAHPGIYELRGDSLKIATQEARGGPRPTEFRPSREGDGKGEPSRSRVIVVHLKRTSTAVNPEEVRNVAKLSQSKNNLKQIGLAMHSYHDANNKLPAQNGVLNAGGGPNPKPLLSWRVHLLPYLEQQALYQQFKLDQPWDSPQNLALVNQMPKIYATPTAPAGAGLTYYKVFVSTGPANGNDALFANPQRYNVANIPDGSSNTIMVIEAGDPVTWTKPDDIPYDAKRPLPNLKLLGNSKVNVLMADGSVRTVDLSKVSEQTLRRVIEPADGNVIGSDW